MAARGGAASKVTDSGDGPGSGEHVFGAVSHVRTPPRALGYRVVGRSPCGPHAAGDAAE